MRRLGTVTAVIAVIASLALPAVAGGYDPCKYNDWKPECQTTTTEATTTTTEATTTTTEATTTTTQATTTTTQATTTTTEEPRDLIALWSASYACDAETARETITVLFGEGIVQINVTMRDPQVGDVEPDLLNPFTESGQVLDVTLPGETVVEWILTPVWITGYEPSPDQLSFFSTTCDEPTTTSSTVSGSSVTTSPTEDTLPFTGVDNGLLVGLGASVLALGALLLFAVRRGEEIG